MIVPVAVATALDNLFTAVCAGTTATGNVAVFDAGDDLVIAVSAANGTTSGVVFVNVVGGGNLITNTAITTGGFYNAVASNFGFNLAAASGTSGLNITFS